MDTPDAHVDMFANDHAVLNLLQSSLHPLKIYLVDSKIAPVINLQDKLCSWSDDNNIYLGIPSTATLPDVLHVLHTMELLLADWPDPEDVKTEPDRAWVRSLLIGAIAGQRVLHLDNEDTISLTHSFFAQLLQDIYNSTTPDSRKFSMRAWALIYMLPKTEHEAALRHVERANKKVYSNTVYLLDNLGELDSEPLLGHLVEAQMLYYLTHGKLSPNG